MPITQHLPMVQHIQHSVDPLPDCRLQESEVTAARWIPLAELTDRRLRERLTGPSPDAGVDQGSASMSA